MKHPGKMAGSKKFEKEIKMENKHGKIGELTVTLKNACVCKECVWNAVHYNGLYENGCYKLWDISDCISGERSSFMAEKEAKEQGLI